eukprot:TRINITY_DN22034_c0_g1_i1.p1 TRINITY_DN22034_c0_g1~~TRINITY_DN22034_c0_g1_i1.p1  ORF type:complete len:142 (+),score=29.58 TRINITY_DN22034_c0_g1_i1:37-426(+)
MAAALKEQLQEADLAAIQNVEECGREIIKRDESSDYAMFGLLTAMMDGARSGNPALQEENLCLKKELTTVRAESEANGTRLSDLLRQQEDEQQQFVTKRIVFEVKIEELKTRVQELEDEITARKLAETK